MSRRRHSLFRSFRRALRHGMVGAFSRLAPAGDAPPPDLTRASRVLLVLVNFRLGNSVLATSAFSAMGSLALGGVSFLGGPAAPPLLDGLGLRRVHTLRRSDLWRPDRLFRLVRDMRRERYDVAVHLGGAAASLGAVLTGLSGARERVGWRGRHGNLFFTTALLPGEGRHKVDEIGDLMRALGAPAPAHRRILLAGEERSAAQAWLSGELGSPRAPIGFFVGARERKGKAWRLASLAAAAGKLRARGLPIVVFLGPEERALASQIRDAFGEALLVEEPNLGRVAALCSACLAVVAPDAGPMHLAIAAGAPVVALFRAANHDRWGPRPPGLVVFDPSGSEVDAIVAAVERVAAPGARA